MQTATVIYSAESPTRIDNFSAIADEDTVSSAKIVAGALSKLGFVTKLKLIKPNEMEEVGGIKSDLVFNLCEWAGLDYKLGVRVAQILEENEITFTGGSSENLLWCCEKQFMKKLFDKFDIPSANWCVYEGGKLNLPDNFRLPAVVKPAWEHCAIGIDQTSVIADPVALPGKVKAMYEHYSQPILVEEFIGGNEYQVTVLGKKGEPWVLPLAEIVYRKTKGYKPILTFSSKWFEDSPEANLSDIRIYKEEKKFEMLVSEIAKRTFLQLDCRDYVRLDVREEKGIPYVLEVNVNPGIGWEEDYGMAMSARNLGMSFEDLISVIVDSAFYRNGKRRIARLHSLRLGVLGA